MEVCEVCCNYMSVTDKDSGGKRNLPLALVFWFQSLPGACRRGECRDGLTHVCASRV